MRIKEIINELKIPAGIFRRDDAFFANSVKVNLHPNKGTHWFAFFDEFYFELYGCPPPVKVINQIIRDISSEYKFQRK